MAKRKQILVVGGAPRVDLLPVEVRQSRKGKVVRRRYGFAVFLLVLLMAGGTALVRAQAVQAQKDLAIEEANSRFLVTQQQKYGEVQNVQKETSTVYAAQRVGTSTEIDWQKYLTAVQATLPANVSLDTVNIDSATPFTPYAQASAPLQGSRIATLSFTAKSSTLPQVPAWLIALTSLPGYADASPNSVIRNETGTYSVSITMHINQTAFTNRFPLVGK